MNFNKLDYRQQQVTAEALIYQFIDDNLLIDTEVMLSLIELLEGLGVQLDACSSCGAMPMNSNCNNARCQDL